MVFFTCNNCGSALKKNQVDKHAYQCSFLSISCMDCMKDFGMKDYGSHTSCVTEAQRYGGEGWVAPSNFNKGEKKQQAWVDTVNNTLKKNAGRMSPPSRNLLQALAKHDNIPRKKAKFMNFVKNIAKSRFDLGTVEELWNLLEEEWKAQAAATTTKTNPLKTPAPEANDNNANGVEEKKVDEDDDDSPPPKKKKGVKNGNDDDVDFKLCKNDESEITTNSKNFSWSATIQSLLESRPPNYQLSLKKLKKKVFSAYRATLIEEEEKMTEEELSSKLMKKLKNNRSTFAIVDDGKVRLVNICV